MNRQGILCVVSGPSGSGKTTLCHRMAAGSSVCAYSVSCTTRPPREREQDGIDYHFLSKSEFEDRIAGGELLEYAQVHGKYYGTLKAPVLENLNRGTDVLMDLDVQGAQQLRQIKDPVIQASLVDIFVLPPSVNELMRRLRGRGKMISKEMTLRMKNAEEEMTHWPRYQYAILSGSKEHDFAEFGSILQAERNRASRLRM